MLAKEEKKGVGYVYVCMWVGGGPNLKSASEEVLRESKVISNSGFSMDSCIFSLNLCRRIHFFKRSVLFSLFSDMISFLGDCYS